MLLQIIRLSLDNLRASKLRSFLTILGVVIGVMSVIFIAAIISGLNVSVGRQVQSLGSNIVTISRLPTLAFRFPTEEERMRKELTLEDAEEIRTQAKNVEMVTSVLPLDFLKFPNPNVRYKNYRANNVKVYGVEPDYIAVYVSNVRYGHFITEGDVQHRTRTVVLGATVADAMFPGEDPTGKSIFFENDEYAVIGVLERRGSIFGFDRDNFIWIPVSTMLKLHPESKDGLIIAMKASSENAMPLVMDQITEIMRRRRHVPFNQPNNFDVGSQNQFLEFYQQITGGAYLVMMVISSIALMVGGIGVMNIMLVSVTERTREIGIRKAVGARRKDILGQFIIEAMVLTGLGGLVGILLGAGVSMLIDALTPFPSTVSPTWVTLAFTISVSVGLFFGIYPAAKASNLDPIEALRYE